MSNEESAAGSGGASSTGRRPRQGSGGSPVGSTLSIVLAVIAVVAGFLILRNITDDGSNAGADVVPIGESTTTTIDPALATTTTSTTTTTIPLVTEGATVIVANANTVGGSAGSMTRTLELAGFEMGEPTNGTGPNLTESIVHFDPTIAAAQDVATSVAIVMGLDPTTVTPVPTPAPTQSGSMGGAGVLVMLGDNQAGLTLEELQAQSSSTETGAAPDPAGGDTTETTAVETTETTVAETDDTTVAETDDTSSEE
jgi:hypothetical protein